MASTEEIFPVFDILETGSPQVESLWNLLVGGLKGEAVPAWALEQFASLEPALLEFYSQEICAYGHRFIEMNIQQLPLNAEEVAALVQELHSKFAEPLARLPFGEESHAAVERQFTAILRIQLDQSELLSSLEEFLNTHDLSSPQAVEILSQYRQTGNLDVEVDKAISLALPKSVYSLVNAHFRGVWNVSVLNDCVHLVRKAVLPALTAIGIYDAKLREQTARLAKEKLAEVRISELFDMITCVDAAERGLHDLKLVMHTPELRSKTVSTLQKDCALRLLNNGVDTFSIILFYWSLVKVLAVLDPRGVVLDKVTPAIHRYLKDRPDTVDIIVDGIIGEESSPLSSLSDKLAPPALPDLVGNRDMLDVSWQPDPIDAPPDFVKRQTNDIVSTFFMLYDNPEVYIKRLNTVFCEKLLAVRTAAELGELALKAESLKRRFGERQLQNIYVMIADVKASLKWWKKCRGAYPALESTRGLILSHRYWPGLEGERGEFPGNFGSISQEYAAAYEKHHPQRKIVWLPEDSQVSVKLELQDRTLDLTVTPGQSSVITYCATGGPLTVHSIANALSMEESCVERALSFWVVQGVLKRPDENGGHFTVLETVGSETQVDAIEPLMEEPSSAAKKASAEMMVYWQYIVGMLTNLGALPADKIHSFLVMFVPKDDPYVKTKQELENFLHLMVGEEKLVESDGKFSLKKT